MTPSLQMHLACVYHIFIYSIYLFRYIIDAIAFFTPSTRSFAKSRPQWLHSSTRPSTTNLDRIDRTLSRDDEIERTRTIIAVTRDHSRPRARLRFSTLAARDCVLVFR